MTEFVEEPIYAQLARIGKAMSNPVRLRLLDLLEKGERTVEQLAGESGIALKNTSAQLQRLRQANLVATRKSGVQVYYRLADPEVSRFLGRFQGFAEERLADLRSAVAEHLGDPAGLTPVTADDLDRRLDDHAVVVVDVRSAAEFAEGHVPGAVSLPMARLRADVDRLPDGVEIIAYCQGPYCVLSPRAAQLLRELGRRARTLEGGLTRWRRTGHRVQAG